MLLVEYQMGKSITYEQLVAHGGDVKWVCAQEALRLKPGTRDLIVLGSSLNWEMKRALRTQIRAVSEIHTPILMVFSEEQQLVAESSLNAAAEDILVAPHGPDELLIKALATVCKGQMLAKAVLRVGRLAFDPNTQVVRLGHRELQVTRLERRLLELLMRECDRFVTADELEKWGWGSKGAPHGSLAVHMHRLRNMLKGHSRAPALESKRLSGYRLSAD